MIAVLLLLQSIQAQNKREMPYFHHFVSDSPSISSNGHNSTPYNSSANNGFVANGAATQQRSNVNGRT